MCGIFGYFDTKPIDIDVAQKMSASLRHRGPNDEGFLLINSSNTVPLGGDDTPDDAYSNRVSFLPKTKIKNYRASQDYTHLLGHRRLSILDLSPSGHQPMSYRDRYWTVYNGEIYNFLELRRELESLGHSFASQSDTEVLLAAYVQWGEECLQRFNGMWSFVIYDIVKKSVFISRDRFGVKPFYYYNKQGTFVFASEPKAMLCHPSVPREPNMEYLEEYVNSTAQEHLLETAFNDIFRLKNAHFISTSLENLQSGNFEQQEYWKLTPNLSNERFSDARAQELAKQYRSILEDAVRIRLRADVKIGSALSGGLDSSSIVFLVNKILKESGNQDLQETFSCVYKTLGTEDCDEGRYINLLAEKLGVNSNQIEAYEKNVPEEHAKVIWAMDTPPENTCMSGWHTFKKVSQTPVTVTLDGQGADEQLAGYLGYIYVYLAGISIKDLFSEAVGFSRIPGVKFHVLAGVAFNLMEKIGLNVVAMYLCKKLTGYDLDKNLNERLNKDSMASLVTLLHYADRTSMAFSIESRMPFLDYRLAEFLSATPACYKMHKGWTKYIARLAFNNDLPSEVCWRKDKMGWPIPEKFWFQGGLKSWYGTSIQGSKLIDNLKLKVHIDCESENAPKSLKALNLATWERQYLA